MLKRLLFSLVSILFFSFAYAGTGSTINVDFTGPAGNVSVGSAVDFIDDISWQLSNGDSSPESLCFGDFTWNFGPNATPQTLTVNYHFTEINFSGSIFPATGVIFNTPGPHTVSLTYSPDTDPGDDCNFLSPPTSVFSRSVLVAAVDAIPTLSEWGIIVLALSLVIFSVLGIRKWHSPVVAPQTYSND